MLLIEPHREDSVYQNSLLRRLFSTPITSRQPLLLLAPRGQVLDSRALNQWVDMTYDFSNRLAWISIGDEN